MKTLIFSFLAVFISFKAHAADGLNDFRRARIPILAPNGFIHCEHYSLDDGTAGVSIMRLGSDAVEMIGNSFVDRRDHSKVYFEVKVRTDISSISGEGESVPDTTWAHNEFVEVTKICNDQHAFPVSPAASNPAPSSTSGGEPPAISPTPNPVNPE